MSFHHPKYASINTQIQFCISLEKTINQTPEAIKQSLQNESQQFQKKYHLDLSYGQEDLGPDLDALFKKINVYSELVEGFLTEYQAFQKLGAVLKIANEYVGKIFSFLKTYLKQRKNYTEQRLRILEQKFETQAPGYCNRCNKFIINRNIQETKVLLGVGQFSDPFDLFDVGRSDFLNSRLKEEDNEYKLRFADVWENKKKIEQKFHLMQIELDRRTYNTSYSAKQIQKIEEVIKGIVSEIHVSQKSHFHDDEDFEKQMIKMVKAIYSKLRQYRNKQILRDAAVQADESLEEQTLEELRILNEKALKKNKQLNKRVAFKQKQIGEMSTKYTKLEDQLVKVVSDKNFFQCSMKNLVRVKVEHEGTLSAMNSEIQKKGKKIDDLERENDGLRRELSKLYKYLEIKASKKANAQIFKSQKSYTSIKTIKAEEENKSVKISDIVEELTENQIPNNKSKQKRGSLRKSLKRSVSQFQNLNLQKQVSGGNQNQGREDNAKMSKLESKGDKETKERHNNQVMIKREDKQKNRKSSSISIQLKQSDKEIEHQSTNVSSKKTKNVAKSMRKIKRKSSIIKKDEQGAKEEANEEKQKDKGMEENDQPSINDGSGIEKRRLQKIGEGKNKSTDKVQFKNLASDSHSNNKFNQSKHKKFRTILGQSKKFSSQTPILNQDNYNQVELTSKLKQLKYHSHHTSPIQKQIHPRNPIIKKSFIPYNNSQNKYNQTCVNVKSFFQQTSENFGKQSQFTSTLPSIYQNLSNIEDKLEKTYEQASYQIYKRFISQPRKQAQVTFEYFHSQIDRFIRGNILSKLGLGNKEDKNQKLMRQNIKYDQICCLCSELRGKCNCKSQYLSGFNKIKGNTYDSQKQSEILQRIKNSLIQLSINEDHAYQLQSTNSILQNFNNTIRCNATLNSFYTNNGPEYVLTEILNKAQLNFLKLITVQLAKIHSINPSYYRVIKNSILSPHSFLFGRLKNNQKHQRKTISGVQPSHDYRKTIRQGILKIVVLHRNCNGSQNSKNYKNCLNSTASSLKNAAKLSINETKKLCRHLINFQQLLKSQIRSSYNMFGPGLAENEQNIENQDNDQLK